METNSDMNWAQHIKIDYAPNLRKCLKNAKQTTFRTFQNSEGNPRGIFWGYFYPQYDISEIVLNQRAPLLGYDAHGTCHGFSS